MKTIFAPVDYRPIPGEDGWFTWNLKDETRYNGAVLGPLKVRHEADGDRPRTRLRMIPQHMHTNIQDIVHGAVTLGLIDIALFAGAQTLGKGHDGPMVTVELSTQFVGAGDPTRPLDAVSELVRETGKLAFVRGEVVQDDDIVAAYSGILRKLSRR
ncbi:PaaI family thioesterase [Alteriqipengyuania lutimaris]|uniref:PaaI family thioesterase n=1 Tax=Alteriqipengyuania lutimaris TaxID=1538146 RepID=A0A395LM71_9SPHN|nr:PaaI family thioesterase [Alteriqipengyuania lutimaris]MBB3032764.1 acyl-coenzyme A thioesterase PaaI-like protein [Alteriqipengyuania lutimaris]RDS78133.1 PaaI family thioesterase [Alteriqipengyuania lutimaris]